MRKLIEYQCEKCGTCYESEEEARECESYHKPLKIIDYYYLKHHALPEYIVIRTDGEVFQYNYGGLASDIFRD